MSNSFANPRTAAHQVPLSMGFPRQVYWSGLPFPSPRDLPGPGTEPLSPASQADSLPPGSHQGSHSEDTIRCQRFMPLCQSPSLKPTMEGNRTKLLPLYSAISWPDPTLEARTGWTFPSFLLSFSLFFEKHLILWFGLFAISQERFREFQLYESYFCGF